MTEAPLEVEAPGILARRRATVGALLVLGLLFLLLPGPASRWAGQQACSQAGLERVNQALEDNLKAFAAVSAVKATLALVEGSAVGMGFHLELGDLVQPAYDYVDFVWKLFLFANLVLFFYRALIEMGLLELGFAVAGSGLLLLAASLLWQGRRALLLRWGRALTAWGLFAAYVVPLALLGSQWIGNRYATPLRERQWARMEAVGGDFRSLQNEFWSVRDRLRLSEPAESFQDLRNTLRLTAYRTARLATQGMGAFLYYAMLSLLELLLLPFAAALILQAALRLLLALPTPALSYISTTGTGSPSRRRPA